MTKFYGVPNAEGELILKSYTESEELYGQVPLSAVELSPEPFIGFIRAVNWYRGRSSAGYGVVVKGHRSGEISAAMSLDRFLRLIDDSFVRVIEDDLWFRARVKFVKKGGAVFVEVVE